MTELRIIGKKVCVYCQYLIDPMVMPDSCPDCGHPVPWETYRFTLMIEDE